MTLLGRKDIELLNKTASDLSISIYVPTHRVGEAVNNDMDKLELKNSLQDLKQQLSDRGLNEREQKKLLEKAWGLVENENFWRNQSDGLAIFITDDFFKHYELPLRFKKRLVISDKFYLKPLMPMLTGDGRFFILAINQKMVEMYEGTRHSITEVYINDLVPKDMESALRYDAPQTQLQFKTGQSGKDGAIFHGHGAGKDTFKERLMNYCRQIDHGLMKMLHDEKPPMILVAEDQLASIYRSANTYHNLLKEYVDRNPTGMDTVFIHELAWEKVGPYFKQAKKDAIREYEELKHTEKTSNKLKEILTASEAGRVGKLLIDENANGESAQSPGQINEAAIYTILNGGDVYFVKEKEQPEDEPILAVMRY